LNSREKVSGQRQTHRWELISFKDLMEANIYPVAINLDDKGASFNRQFFYESPNRIGQYIETNTAISECLRVIDVSDYAMGCHLDLVMDDEKGQAIAFCVPDKPSEVL